MFHKIMPNLEKNAGNRGHNLIFLPRCPNIILIVTLKRVQKSNWGKIYDIFSLSEFNFFPLKACNNCSTSAGGVMGGKYGKSKREIKS
jgi:hypothetical protein